MTDQNTEIFELTISQLNVLIVKYYEPVGCVTGAYNSRRPEIKELVNRDLLYITYMAREVSAIHSMGDGSFAKFISTPANSQCEVAITEEGKKLVEQVSLSRRADACIVEGDSYIISNFVDTLDVKDLPEFLSSSHEKLREGAADRLAACLEATSVEDLPELLTDSDSVVRETASDILAASTSRFDVIDIGTKGEMEE